MSTTEADIRERLATSTRTVCEDCETIEIEIAPGYLLKLDELDWHYFVSRRWRLTHPGRSKKRYMQGGSRKSLTYLHRLITNAPKGIEVDHVNGDGLDNRRANLRLVTHGQNLQNIPEARQDSKTGVRGVSWYARGQCYRAFIGVNGRSKYLGSFATIVAAEEAYKEARRTYHTHAPQEAQ